MGMVQLELAKAMGIEFMQGKAASLDLDDAGNVTGVRIKLATGEMAVWRRLRPAVACHGDDNGSFVRAEA